MSERKLERVTVDDRRLFEYGYHPKGFSLKFVSGPELTKDVKPGSWLDSWEVSEGKTRFSFGPRKNVFFATKEVAIAVQTDLKQAVDIITEIAE